MKTIKEYQKILRFWNIRKYRALDRIKDINKELDKIGNVTFDNCIDYLLLVEYKSILQTDLYVYNSLYNEVNLYYIC